LAKFHLDLDALKRLAHFAAKRSGENRIPQVAGSLTFTTVLALVPLVTVAFALLTAFPIFSSFQSSLQGFLADHLMPAQINSQIFRYLNEFAAKAKSLTTMGMIALIATSVLTMMTVEAAFNVIWRVRKARPLAQRMLIYWAIITLGPILFGTSLSISSYLISRSMSIAGAHQLPAVIAWALATAVLPLSALAFAMLYVYLPNCKVEWRDGLMGGVAAAVAFELAKRGFGLYIRSFPTYTAVYGAFAAVPIFLLWVYLSWFITLFGATLTAALPAIRIGQYQRVRMVGSDLLDALELLARLAGARAAGRPGYTQMQLARKLRCDIDTVTRIVDALEARNHVARLYENGNARRLILLANPEQLPLAELVDMFVLDRGELAYQLNLPGSRIDSTPLLAALGNDKLEVSLAALLRSGPGRRALAPPAREPVAGSALGSASAATPASVAGLSGEVPVRRGP
jgi:membrane protein